MRMISEQGQRIFSSTTKDKVDVIFVMVATQILPLQLVSLTIETEVPTPKPNYKNEP